MLGRHEVNTNAGSRGKKKLSTWRVDSKIDIPLWQVRGHAFIGKQEGQEHAAHLQSRVHTHGQQHTLQLSLRNTRANLVRLTQMWVFVRGIKEDIGDEITANPIIHYTCTTDATVHRRKIKAIT